jgi:DNA polymerase-4
MEKKFIAHLDLDCFFVSVERINDPSLVGKPVVVGGSASGRGVVASASYEARKFGVRSAMPTAQALRLCPNCIVVSGHHRDYSACSRRLHKRLTEIAPVVEQTSIDEMYLDFTGCEKLYGNDLPGYIKKLQAAIKKEFNLPCTIALASNKLVAKIAANTVKPEGTIFIPHGTEEKFLSTLPVEVIPGVGKITEAFLKKRGIKLVGDLQKLELKTLSNMFGMNGKWLYEASRGRGSASLHMEHTAKSISKEETFASDISNITELEKILIDLVADVCSTLRSKFFKAKTIQLKLRNSKFQTSFRRQTVKPMNYDPDIFNIAKLLLQKIYIEKNPVRLIGVGLSNFVEDVTEDELFPDSDKRENVLKAVDRLRKKYGDDLIRIGSV